jgi:hypothetical protein
VIRVATPRSANRNRDQFKLDFSRAAPLREIYPQLAELRIEFDYEDGSERPPSSVAYAYFPAARGFFRFSCPCHSCNGEFDLSAQVAELAGETGRQRRSRRMQVSCTGLSLQETRLREPCPIGARVRISAALHPEEQSA